jgi:hypothetical protein
MGQYSILDGVSRGNVKKWPPVCTELCVNMASKYLPDGAGPKSWMRLQESYSYKRQRAKFLRDLSHHTWKLLAFSL